MESFQIFKIVNQVSKYHILLGTEYLETETILHRSKVYLQVQKSKNSSHPFHTSKNLSAAQIRIRNFQSHERR